MIMLFRKYRCHENSETMKTQNVSLNNGMFASLPAFQEDGGLGKVKLFILLG